MKCLDSSRVVKGTTAVYGILGDPIAHSLSPVMQNDAFLALGMDAVFIPFRVQPESLAQAVDGLRALNIQGVNVTIPHKEAVCPLLDDIDEAAQLIGAVNTIVNQDGRLIGYNTDGIGLIRSLQTDLDFECSPTTRVVVFGAGGAARAAVVALAQQRVEQICIVNRTVGRAQELVDLYRPHFPETDFTAVLLDEKCLTSFFGECELIINSTSIGLSGESFNVVAWTDLKKGCAVYDMVYSPKGTPLVRDAKAAGFRACYGLGMLAAQGEEAFRLWTGECPNGVMRVALDTYLKGL